MQKHLDWTKAIQNLQDELSKIPKRKKDTNIWHMDWWNTNKEESIRNQIELYKIWKWRLQVTN